MADTSYFTSLAAKFLGLADALPLEASLAGRVLSDIAAGHDPTASIIAFTSQIRGRIGPILTPQSSNVEAITFYPALNTDDQILEITFIGGRVYQYRGVPFEEFVGLYNADSKGTYVNAFLVNGPYEFDRIA